MIKRISFGSITMGASCSRLLKTLACLRRFKISIWLKIKVMKRPLSFEWLYNSVTTQKVSPAGPEDRALIEEENSRLSNFFCEVASKCDSIVIKDLSEARLRWILRQYQINKRRIIFDDLAS